MQNGGKTMERRLLLATFLFWFSMYTYPSFLASYVEKELQLGAVVIGAITGSYGFTQMIVRIPLGVLSDTLRRRKPFMIFGMACSAVVSLGLMLSRSGPLVLIFRGLSGVAASTWAMYSVLYSACVPPERLGSAMSTLSFYQYGSQVIAMLAGAYLADHVGRWSAFALSLTAGLAGVFAVCGLREPEDVSVRRNRILDYVQILKSKRLLTATALSTIFHFSCWGTVLGFTVNWASGVVGLTTSQLGLLSSLYLIPNTIVSKCTGRMQRHMTRRQLNIIGFIVITAASFLYSYAFTPLALYAVQVFYGCGMGLIIPTTAADAIADIPQEKRATAMSFFQSVFGMGMFLGPMVAGAIVQGFSTPESMIPGYRANFTAMALIGLLGLLVAVFIKNREDK